MKKKTKFLSKLLISDIASQGKCIARHEDKVIFVENAAPGDIVNVRITKDKKKFAEAKIVSFESLSPNRETPFCKHFGICGGCKWQHLPYQQQLAFKEKEVIDNFERIGKLTFPKPKAIIPSPNTTFYRNKLEYTFSSKRWLTKEEIDSGLELERNALGFHAPGRFDKIIDIETCYLQNEVSNRIRNAVKSYAHENKIPFFDLVKQEGFLRNLIIRNSNTEELMVILQVFAEKETEGLLNLLQFIKNQFPEITALQYVLNTKGNETFYDLEVKTFSGKDYITEEMEGLKFRIGPKSFFQTNAVQAYELYKIARAFAELKGVETVYDLYTGTGTIANFVSKQAQKVVGVESVEMAVEDAKKNAALNGINNTRFFAGDMKDILNENFSIEHGKPDVIITDPPRAGMHEKVVQALLDLAPQRLVYVSCNPATQARDLALLDTAYQITAVQPVDMFPHTYHVENVVKLVRR